MDTPFQKEIIKMKSTGLIRDAIVTDIYNMSRDEIISLGYLIKKEIIDKRKKDEKET